MKEINKLIEDFPCDLCGAKDEEFLYIKRGSITNYPFRLVRCRSCGLLYLNPRLGEKAIRDLYDENYYAGKGFDPYVDYLTDFAKENDNEKTFHPSETVNLIKNITPSPAKLLDFGCGLGDLILQANKQGYHAEGYEVSDFSREFARSKGIKVYSDLNQLPMNSYDIVVAIEVLEHCSSPMEALMAIYQSLKPGGVFYYTTLNFDGFYVRWRLNIKSSLDNYIVPEGHIHFFSTDSIIKYFKKIGFSEVIKFNPYRIRGRLYNVLSKIGLVDEGFFPKSWLNKIVYYILINIAAFYEITTKNLPLAKK